MLGRQEERANFKRDQERYLSHLAAIVDGIPIPIIPFPADPQNTQCAEPWEYLGLNDDGWIGPDLAVLPAADYDVYVFVDLWNEEMGNESQQQCLKMTVSVSGETHVTAPPLEDCP